MNRFSKCLAVAFKATMFLTASLHAVGVAQAMEIQQFDKMAVADQNEYVADLAIGAEKVLRDEGRSDLADKVQRLFTEIRPGDQITVGIGEFDINLALARVADAKRLQKNPNARRLEVEDAMAVTLQKNHIELPDSFFTVLSGFRPKFSPQPKLQPVPPSRTAPPVVSRPAPPDDDPIGPGGFIKPPQR